ncbi:MAG: prepilin-type N-terminal cleavage/methylation domain-containing protein [Paludibacterium sp.]|uniref:type 4 pilus major pilin n=1 Tax=Paludibacterium sp. TaxID=1917523 RepID=UPI0025F9ABE5|nr:type 4 pilus major pilin [Paludibacterium sp.]MBV8046451.1 prepilin-type N-terminal cleavage/methylation domain-containing protein [Paludibacterium sp.]MBV8645843.1 prepilin-type N-terminal cleavage/methylation domain-containing protein [Paludibacterium sp.]
MRKQYINNIKRRQRGLTLIEAAMVLALSAVVVAGAVMYYQSASENNKSQVALGQLGMIQSTVQTITGSTANYSGLVTADLARSSNIPASQKSGNTLISPWGNLTVTGATDTYDVVMAKVPQGPCQTLAGQDLGSSLMKMKIGGADASSPGKAAAALCTGATQDLAWTFR